jgi:hypothetical protein
VVSVLALSSCATFVRGVQEDLIITSIPAHADVFVPVEGKHCVTPCRVHVRRGRRYEIVVRRTGYQDAVVRVSPELSGSASAHATVGAAVTQQSAAAIGAAHANPIGAAVLVIDVISGAATSLSPNPVMVRLVPISSP